jgi:hypothetical protein
MKKDIPVLYDHENLATSVANAILKAKEAGAIISSKREEVEKLARTYLSVYPNVQSVKFATHSGLPLTVTEVKSFSKIPISNEKSLRDIFSVKFEKMFSVNKNAKLKEEKMNELFDFIRDAGRDPYEFFEDSSSISMDPEFRTLVEEMNLGRTQKKCAEELLEESSGKMRFSVR